MRRYLRRLGMAFIFSTACYSGTEFWYRHSMKEVDSDSDAKALAKLESRTSEVQRKPARRVIWEPITENELLYGGDTVRTPADGEAKVLLFQGRVAIELEPESMVTIEEDPSGFFLNFITGNVVVNNTQADGAADNLRVKVGEKQISLNNAKVRVGGDNSGKANVEVQTGAATVKAGDKTLAIDQGKALKLSKEKVETVELIKILSPASGESVFVPAKSAKTMAVRFEKLPKEYSVSVEMGDNPKELKAIDELMVPGDSGEIQVPVLPGRIHWRLRAKSVSDVVQDRASNLAKNFVRVLVAPQLFSPKPDEVLLGRKDSALKFQWISHTPTDLQNIEIAKDEAFTDSAVSYKIEASASSLEMAMLPPGRYFWRLRGKKGKHEMLSDTSTFMVQQERAIEPPELLKPSEGQVLSLQDVQNNGVLFSWKPVLGVKSYELVIQTGSGGTTQNYTAHSSQIAIKDLKAGDWTWHVIPKLDDRTPASVQSQNRSFKVKEIEEIRWVDGQEPGEIRYFTKTPYLMAGWKPTQAPVTQWQYRYAGKGEDLNSAQWSSTGELTFRETIEADGVYTVEVVGLGAEGQVIARSQPKSFTVSAVPLLPPPELVPGPPEVLQSDLKGNVDVQWKSVDGAQLYRLGIYDKDGKLIKRTLTERNVASLEELKPGQYKLVVQSVDSHRRVGPATPVQQLVVPTRSSIPAPKVKRIKVK